MCSSPNNLLDRAKGRKSESMKSKRALELYHFSLAVHFFGLILLAFFFFFLVYKVQIFTGFAASFMLYPLSSLLFSPKVIDTHRKAIDFKRCLGNKVSARSFV